MEYEYDHLIVGAGMTADAAAKAIHDADAATRIGVVGDEKHAPYERPPLSKALWKDDKPVESIDLGTAKTGAVLHLGRRIVALDRVAHRATDDQDVGYLLGRDPLSAALRNARRANRRGRRGFYRQRDRGVSGKQRLQSDDAVSRYGHRCRTLSAQLVEFSWRLLS